MPKVLAKGAVAAGLLVPGLNESNKPQGYDDDGSAVWLSEDSTSSCANNKPAVEKTPQERPRQIKRLASLVLVVRVFNMDAFGG